ncbi:MAG: Fic family protein [Bacilli bacterium]|nr:Fic family protein [Bacilli bacterium]
MEKYIPPFTITNTMLDYISSIMEKIGKLDNYNNLNKMPILRKNNRINSIHSSLAIEANSLSLNQMRDVINGKTVIGPQKEIQEVKNAFNAYEKIKDTNPYSITDLKEIHGIMTYLILDESGDFRKGNEGVFDGDKCIFMAPPPKLVNDLMNNLFDWMKESNEEIHPLLLSSIFHYEFVFIHPFSDGNGRIARLWQNIILSKWKGIFKYLPIETRIKEYQNEYYTAISNCHKNGNSNDFIEFMLKMINKVLEELISDTSSQINHINSYITKLLNVMEYDLPMSSSELMEKLELKSKDTFRDNYLNPAIEAGLVKPTIPDKPTSKNQKYFKV